MPTTFSLPFAARLRTFLGDDAAGTSQAFAALLLSSFGDLLAGLSLGAIKGTLEDLPGLMVLVPAAIGMRGNVFGALGSRLGTSIHTGEFRLSRRRDTLVGQNIYASVALTISLSLALAILAKALAGVFSDDSIGIADFIVISMLGGILSSAVVLALTLVVARTADRRGWDMDNVAAPAITAAGDIVTIPALFAATFAIDIPLVTPVLTMCLTLLAVVCTVLAWRSGLPVLRRIVHESLPILLVAGTVSLVAGVTISGKLDTFLALPALLVLVTPFLEDTGALGAILASRLSTKLHLGIIEPRAKPQRAARRDFLIIGLLAIPVFTFLALSADLVSIVLGLESPGALRMVGITLTGGLIAVSAASLVAYYGSVATYRLGLDPDNHAIPILTSSMDLVGSLALILAMALFGVTS